MKKKDISLNDIDKKNTEENIKNKGKRETIFERFSTKENIIIFSFFLIFLILIWNIIKSYDPYSKIDYRKINVETLLQNSSVEYNRENYWILNGILLRFLHSDIEKANTDNYSSSNYSIDQYYEILNEDFGIYLNKEKFIELSSNVIEKYKSDYENLNGVDSEVPIRKIYKINNYDGDYFLVRLNTKKDTYVGIRLYKNYSTYKIFYLE